MISLRLDALGLGERMDVAPPARRRDRPRRLRIAGADRDLVHVDVGRIEQRAAFRHRHGGDRARHVLGAQRRALERIDGDVDLRAVAAADLLADEQHRRLVALALADHDRAVDRQPVQLAPHGVDRRLVGGLLVAAPAPLRGGDRGALGDAHDLEREDAVQRLLGLAGLRSTSLSRQSPVLACPTSRDRLDPSQFFSIRMTCGWPAMTPCFLIAFNARRTASSVVA